MRCEPPPVLLANLRFLAGYRRDWLFDPVLLDELRAAELTGVLLGRRLGEPRRPGGPAAAGPGDPMNDRDSVPF